MFRKIQLAVLCAVAFCGAAVAAGTVSGVKARQRYPWNGMVDIDCMVSGDAGTTSSMVQYAVSRFRLYEAD